MGNELAKIENLRVVEYNGEPVITFAMVDELHERVEGTAGRTFRKYRGKFLSDVDYFTADQSTLNVDYSSSGGKDPILLTQTGYLMLVKPFRDDKSWQVQRYLVNHYFRSQSTLQQGNKAIGLEVAEGIREGLRVGLQPIQDDVRHLKNDVSAINNQVAEINDQLRTVVRRKEPTAATKRQHVDTVADFYNGRCPCCGERDVLDEFLNKLSTAHWDHWYAPHRRSANETWLVCSQCNIAMKTHSHRMNMQAFFNAYQQRRDQKHCPLLPPE